MNTTNENTHMSMSPLYFKRDVLFTIFKTMSGDELNEMFHLYLKKYPMILESNED